MRNAFIILTVLALVGCGVERTTSIDSTGTDPSKVKLAVGGIDDYNRFLAANKGQVILVDFWATWCGPCVENFPHTVELAHRYETQGLATMSVSFDDPENEPSVRAFLASQANLTFQNLISKDGGSPASAEAFDFNGAVPHYRLYNRAGELVMAEDGLPEDLEQRIEALLAEDK